MGVIGRQVFIVQYTVYKCKRNPFDLIVSEKCDTETCQ
jgi:hypothetical protein